MKLTLFLVCLVTSLGAYSCRTAEESNEQAPTQAVPEETIADSMVRDTVTNSQGVKLIMVYDNARHSATFMLKGESIILKQDTLASGIRYSNAEYEYTEHQSQISLKKGGKIVFSNP